MFTYLLFALQDCTRPPAKYPAIISEIQLFLTQLYLNPNNLNSYSKSATSVSFLHYYLSQSNFPNHVPVSFSHLQLDCLRTGPGHLPAAQTDVYNRGNIILHYR